MNEKSKRVGELSAIYAVFLNKSAEYPESTFLAEARDLAFWQLNAVWREYMGLPPADGSV